MLEAYLSGRGIEYENRDVSRDPAAVHDLVNQYGSRSTPTVVIGDQVVIGFSPERLDQLLDD
jgi:glutaredoxin